MDRHRSAKMERVQAPEREARELVMGPEREEAPARTVPALGLLEQGRQVTELVPALAIWELARPGRTTDLAE